MGLLAAGQVVVLPFPFSDLSQNKYRPVLLLAEENFVDGGLAHASYVRPGTLFTAHMDLVEQIAGTVKSDFLNQAREAIIQMVRGKT